MNLGAKTRSSPEQDQGAHLSKVVREGGKRGNQDPINEQGALSRLFFLTVSPNLYFKRNTTCQLFIVKTWYMEPNSPPCPLSPGSKPSLDRPDQSNPSIQYKIKIHLKTLPSSNLTSSSPIWRFPAYTGLKVPAASERLKEVSGKDCWCFF